MKIVIDKRTGAYCDSERSWKVYPGDKAFIEGPNAMGRFGGTVDDFLVLETAEERPHLLKYVAGELVPDTDKLQEIADAEAAAQAVADQKATLKAKLEAGTASDAEVQALLAAMM